MRSAQPKHAPCAVARARPSANHAGVSADRGKWYVLVAIGVGTFMSALDGSVVNAILPVMRDALHADIDRIEWVVTIYLLVVSGLLLGFGRIGDLRGHKDVYVLGLAGFTVTSGLCGLAPNADWLIAARGVQAICAAGVYANSPAILTKTFPAEQRGRALGLQATMTYLGLTAGPSLGGVLAQHLGWRSVFYINVPVGAAAVLLSLKFIARDRPAHQGTPFDWAGAAVFFFGLLSLLFALNQGHAWGWTSAPTLALAAAALVLLAVFVVLERTREHPMLDLSLFRRAAFSAAAGAAVLNYVCLYGVLFLLPFYLLQTRGLTPQQAGLLLTAQPLVMMLAAPAAGALSDRIGTRTPGIAGLAILAVGLFLLSRVGLHTGLWTVAGDLAVCGLGTGTFIAPNNSGLMGAAPKHRQGIAAGVLATARNVGMVLGVGLAGAVLTTFLAGARDKAAGVVAAVAFGFALMSVLSLVGSVVTAVRPERALDA